MPEGARPIVAPILVHFASPARPRQRPVAPISRAPSSTAAVLPPTPIRGIQLRVIASMPSPPPSLSRQETFDGDVPLAGAAGLRGTVGGSKGRIGARMGGSGGRFRAGFYSSTPRTLPAETIWGVGTSPLQLQLPTFHLGPSMTGFRSP
ncbi:unnamed protein product [Cyclocybe aegerita]|uniref:Uncharacterized protein n=1 Tax=Cyclocybe aegerita TaxID=1973307 RepID=A0A8S0WYP5_CYCAE|nr:unnamed protein product [Cyclocybe aegerita]